MRLLRFVARRLLQLVPVLFGVVIVTFLLVRVLPGDPIRSILGPAATEADVAAAQARYGLDQPLWRQFLDYLQGLATGDLGTSIQSGGSVGAELAVRIGPTLELVILSLAVALLLATTLGIWSARRAHRLGDHSIRVVALAGNSLPDFWLGLVLILVGYSMLGWFPPPAGRIEPGTGLTTITGAELVDATLTGNGEAFLSALRYLILPVATLSIVITAPLLRSVRASALEVLHSPAYTAAAAHGLPDRLLRRGYLVRAALVRLPPLAALVFGFGIGSTVLVEFVFSWQGFGQWALRGLLFRDYPVVQASVLVIAACYVLVFLIADVVQAMLDPRVRVDG
ncbi:ABC transporter permease [Natronosporangium hydrolyticum]|uniref:ABC transporter permease n=1 Tax=Natronosporangium hydrolyticum TaxID=2811111 RepID=A0A895YKF0_9ACTN|nr:ABC transporter permease [Natronosporangium hydrolyticum]QSB15979.1 ABC transporter permease [Natronosporangium hydrolyticum]